jgi:hypothetical protein
MEDLGLGSTISAVLAQPAGSLPVGAAEAKQRKEEREQERKQRLERKLLREKEHVVPDAATDIQRERALVKVATRGVVMLFNAISQQQKHKSEEEQQDAKGKKKRKARSDEMTKQEFMDRLKNSSNKNQEEQQEWKVFKDDYVHELAEENEWEEELE